METRNALVSQTGAFLLLSRGFSPDPAAGSRLKANQSISRTRFAALVKLPKQSQGALSKRN